MAVARPGQILCESSLVHSRGNVRHLSGFTGLIRHRLSSESHAHAPSGRLLRISPRRSGAISVSRSMKSCSSIPRNTAIRTISASDTRTIPSLIRQHAPHRRQTKLDILGTAFICVLCVLTGLMRISYKLYAPSVSICAYANAFSPFSFESENDYARQFCELPYFPPFGQI